ncbi:MAG: endonuclease III [Verrucomicrobia bacterium]|nr:endonuclease III [Verrucomicrobiota bacterium]
MGSSPSIRITKQLRQRQSRILELLSAEYPDAGCELDFTTVLELTVATILSAQCTDKRVNMVTPSLFRKYRSASDWAVVPQDVLEKEIRSTGFFRNKARNIRALAARLDKDFGGQVPDDLDTLVKLPGIGRKTANLILAVGYGRPGIVVDTHFKRVSTRLGFTNHSNPDRIEFDLKTLVPEEEWSQWSHCMVFHGRRCCSARKPDCGRCPVATLCPSCVAKS